MDMDFYIIFNFWRNISSIKKMKKKKINLFITLIIILFVFVTLLVGLNKQSIYTNENIVIKNIENFKSKELYSNKEVDFISLTDKNKITILNIWASWCLPCRNEHDFLMNLSKYQDINVIGINYKDNPESAKSFINQLGNPFEVIIIDDKGLISIELGAYGVPETYLIRNKDKKIIKKFIGPLDNIKYKEIISLIK